MKWPKIKFITGVAVKKIGNQDPVSEGEEGHSDEILPDNDIEAIVRPPGGSDEAPETGYEDRDDGFIDYNSKENNEDTPMTMT